MSKNDLTAGTGKNRNANSLLSLLDCVNVLYDIWCPYKDGGKSVNNMTIKM